MVLVEDAMEMVNADRVHRSQQPSRVWTVDSALRTHATDAADALHHAVQRLRESGTPFSSWIPFIHVGR
jgi:hypothetical protein